jgi:hypothetical protein
MTASSMISRVYLDPGDRWVGRYDPPRPCRVLIRWRPVQRGERSGPRSVLVEYLDDGSRAVIPFTRRLRRAVVPGAVDDG